VIGEWLDRDAEERRAIRRAEHDAAVNAILAHVDFSRFGDGVKPDGAKETYEQIMLRLSASAQAAARDGRPMLWAHYLDIAELLADWFGDLINDVDGGYAGAALALTQIAEEKCPTLSPTNAARLWSMSVYARQILAAWVPGNPRPSLQWLRDRAAVPS
jgi:hypothetical protein